MLTNKPILPGRWRAAWRGLFCGLVCCGVTGLTGSLPVNLSAQVQPASSLADEENLFGDAAATDTDNTQVAQKVGKIPPPLTEFKGRQIAQTMHYLGAEWLTRDNREQEERCSLMLTSLGIKRGMSICDMGCGNGFYSLKMAKMVGPAGHVYGVDIQPEMLKFLNDRADEKGISNITPILGTLANPRLPKGKIDLISLIFLIVTHKIEQGCKRRFINFR